MTTRTRLADPAFRAIFEDSPIGICVVDKDLNVVDVNAAYCEMLGRTEAEVISSRIPDFTHPHDQKRDAEFLALVLAGRIPHYKADKRYIRQDGETIWARIVVTAILDPSGRSRYAFSMAQVITDERALRGILPVCSSCRRVKDGEGRWSDLESFLRVSANAELSRERCPDCQTKA
jgi:PAS domain S-box-containing protein